MSANPLSDVGFARYFALLRMLLPHGMEFYICTLGGKVLAADPANLSRIQRTRVRTDTARKRAAAHADARLAMDAGDDGTTYVMDIRTPAGEVAGLLVAVSAAGAAHDAAHDSLVEAAFAGITDCIEKEYRLTVELNAMAQELSGRYEELNLVYDADDSASVEQESITLQQLIDSYAEYLDVDMVALLYADRERSLYAIGKNDPVHEPDELLRQLLINFLPQVREDGGCLLINDISDRRRDELSVEMPYKILSCAVTNSRDEVDSVLICLNHIYRPDFFNSDRNLLKVMARKVAKITQSNYDALTGLMNQHAFETVLERALQEARADGLQHSVLNIDIDQLQVLNEAHGRETGDQVIRRVGELLRGKLRSTDTVGYLGEGRYGVLLEKCNIEEGMRVADALSNRVQHAQISRGPVQLDVQVSIGVTTIEPHTDAVGEAMEAAELARIAAKEQGRGRVQAFRMNDQDLVARRSSMQCVVQIQKALRERRFALYCQTIKPVGASAEQFHVEILLRMLDEDGGIVSPERFIPPAEQFNLMPAIDRLVIDETLATLAAAGIAVRPGQGMVAINLSGQSLADASLAAYIVEKIRQYGIASDCLCFEVTETAAISNREAALSIIERVRSVGCHFSLDDFGTGLSSFSYLKELPVDYVKIDGSFVRQILDDRVSHAMVASIIQIGHVMGLKTIAEYVENGEIAERLEQMGADYLQGYGIARPQPLPDYLSGLLHVRSTRAG